MAITASAKAQRPEPVAEGPHIAICISIIDLGIQEISFQGESKQQRRVMLTWEIPDDPIEKDGEAKPKVISKEYTLSLNEKAKLREHLEAWRGKKFTEAELEGFDLVNILGKPCQMQVVMNDRGYSNVGVIMAVPKGLPVQSAYHPLTYFDLTDPKCLTLMEGLPEWIQNKIKQSETYIELRDGKNGGFVEVEGDDTLPF
ncbi:hypothetical protein H8711_05970 [Clostridiaceae bacterium NSJ-31]|uniref:Uncharacterized protein n=1 Tax=Ligaoa zhengdingensis TaxID=2763658 RepID=A0A926E0B5_9FIRM|nr:hypothetical protein [Ligaoa zhengdingensis]MBC8546480.1 hypothetical protein [Ligaoa zhengdingensis]